MLKIKLVAIFLVISLSFALVPGISAEATEETFMSAGISTYLNPVTTNATFEVASIDETLCINQKFQLEQQRIGDEFAMANVQKSLNIRLEPDEGSDRVGVLYKDNGGIILDRDSDWIKIKSGDVVGWAKEEFLLTGEEAQAMADDVGHWLATIETDVVRVRQEPNLESETLGYIAYDDGLTIIEIINEEWVSVDYEGEVGYVVTEFISVRFHIDEGETIEVIKAREAAEAEKRRTANRGRVDASADEIRLLGALIYCEAGNQSYEGKVGVGAVVMNRVKSGAYPNTIHGVIYASGQFPPALNGKVARIYEQGVPASCLQAAEAAINGETTVGGATRFNRNRGTREGIVIGAHIFW
ncbi:MAG: cell wall hydrolase [Lachnospiraceae bacterium]|nr:cell wall hydrolase [Lachnospiraceae bacterium]